MEHNKNNIAYGLSRNAIDSMLERKKHQLFVECNKIYEFVGYGKILGFDVFTMADIFCSYILDFLLSSAAELCENFRLAGILA